MKYPLHAVGNLCWFNVEIIIDIYPRRNVFEELSKRLVCTSIFQVFDFTISPEDMDRLRALGEKNTRLYKFDMYV